MPKIRKQKATSQEHSHIETHYYQEFFDRKTSVRTIEEVVAKAEITLIERCKKSKGHYPEGVTCETGFSRLAIVAADPASISENPHLLTKKIAERVKKRARCSSDDESVVILERKPCASRFPVSCIETVEHVIAAADGPVPDYDAKTHSADKSHVVYQIFLKINTLLYEPEEEKASILRRILAGDRELNAENISVSFNPSQGIFVVEASSQHGDVQKIIRSLLPLKRYYTMVDKEFDHIALNQGVCFVRKDGRGSIHALVNVADTPAGKVFVERDAGAMSGTCMTYTDAHWTMGFFKSREQIETARGYPKDSHYAVGIRLRT
jgi:hypothetical protein